MGAATEELAALRSQAEDAAAALAGMRQQAEEAAQKQAGLRAQIDVQSAVAAESEDRIVAAELRCQMEIAAANDAHQVCGVCCAQSMFSTICWWYNVC